MTSGELADYLMTSKSMPSPMPAARPMTPKARQLIKLDHEVKLMPPYLVKPYVKRSKNDAADAAAICEAVTRPTMRFVRQKAATGERSEPPHNASDESRSSYLFVKSSEQFMSTLAISNPASLIESTTSLG